MNIDETIGEGVADLLKLNRESREQLATALNLSIGTVGRRIRGEEPWKASEVAVAAQHFGVSVEDLYGGTQRMFPGRVNRRAVSRCSSRSPLLAA